MKIVMPLTAVVLGLAGCSSQGDVAAHSAAATPSAPVTVTAQAQDKNPASASSIALNLRFSGNVAGPMTQPQVQGSLCGAPNSPISTIVTGDVGSQPVTLQVIVNYVAAGDSQALVVMRPPPGTLTPSTPGAFGDDGLTWSTFAGHAIIEPDGRSATIAADLAHVGSPVVVEHVEGSWNCPARSGRMGTGER